MQLNTDNPNKMNFIVKTFCIMAFYLAMSLNAHAYLDPVTGSLLIQGLIALVAGIVAGVKSVREKLLVALSRLFKRKDK